MNGPKKQKKKAVLFLNGKYSTRDFPLYQSLCRGKLKIAVDGGVSYFNKSKSKPDMIIGDFDSSRISPDKLRTKYPKAEILTYPVEKDKTDIHLAIDICLERGVSKIDIVQPSLGELDHLLGNLMLLTKFKTKPGEKNPVVARLIGPTYEASLLDNRSLRVIDKKGWGLSIIPLSKRIKLSSRGLQYPASEIVVRQGESRSLRNLVTMESAQVTVEGQAFMIVLKP